MRRTLALAALLVTRVSFADEPAKPEEKPAEKAPYKPVEPTKPVDPNTVDPELVNPTPAPPPTTVPTPPPVKPPRVKAKRDEPTAADVDGAPLPGRESGRTDHPDGDSLLRDIGQGVLAVPRVAFVTALTPVRVGVYAYDHYGIGEKFNAAFFDATSTYGLYPIASIDSQWGLNIGARFVHRNLAGDHERATLKATTGGQFYSTVAGGLRSGTRLGKQVTLELQGEYERRPRDPFYGIGNNSTGHVSRYREELKRVTTYLDYKPFKRFIVRGTGALTDRNYAPASLSEGTPIDAMYDTMALTGFSGTQNMYGELELRIDDRERDMTPGNHRIFDGGWMVSGFTGRVHQLQAGTDYSRYGGEAQHFLGLGVGPRTLMTRVRFEGVTGDMDDIVFNQLPSLGGSTVLRGYPAERFRDRASVVGTGEYFWGLGQMFLASLFVDFGRVYPSFADLTTDRMRLGYGASLQLHSSRQFVAGLSVASSVDGGLFVNLTFDPVFDYDPRAERR